MTMEHIAAMRPALEVEVAEIICRYRELLLAVGRKYPNETRHQTALRYIRQAEAPMHHPPGQATHEPHFVQDFSGEEGKP